MNFRCSKCHQTVWIPAENRSGTVHADCRGCGQRYELKTWRKLLAGGARLARRARELAQQNTIDLPGAYSVLLGVMTVADVREFAGEKRKAVLTGRKGYDPAFAEAVANGHLTPSAALQRGNREACAAKLCEQREFPMDLAYMVADNRMSLLEAIRETAARAGASESVRIEIAGGGPSFRTLGIGLAAGLTLIVFLTTRTPTTTTWADLVTTAVGEATVVTDATGHVLQVAGPNPQSVLQAFCRVGNGEGALEEVSVLPASERLGRARLGLLRSSADPTTLLSIVIQENPELGQWIVGDGISRVSPGPAPDGAYRIVPTKAPEANRVPAGP